MDFIERFLGLSPDHGNGSFEAIILIVVVTVTAGLGMGYFHKHHTRDLN